MLFSHFPGGGGVLGGLKRGQAGRSCWLSCFCNESCDSKFWGGVLLQIAQNCCCCCCCFGFFFAFGLSTLVFLILISNESPEPHGEHEPLHGEGEGEDEALYALREDGVAAVVDQDVGQPGQGEEEVDGGVPDVAHVLGGNLKMFFFGGGGGGEI